MTQKPPSPAAAVRRRKILVVDDSPVALLFVAEALEKAGHTVRTVLFPDEVTEPLVEIVRRCRPDLVLSDLSMPMLRGDHFVKAIRAAPDLAGLKVYFFSSAPAAELESKTREARADGFLRKSNDEAAFVARVQDILS